jgi:hypothetical protein
MMRTGKRFLGYIEIALCLALSGSLRAEQFGNRRLTMEFDVTRDRLHLGLVEDLISHEKIEIGEAFVLVLQDGREIRSSEMSVTQTREAVLQANPGASRASERLAGKNRCIDLVDRPTGILVSWCMVARGEGETYLRQEMTIHAGKKALDLADVQMLRVRDTEAKIIGQVAGSPIVIGNFYRGFEHPLSYNLIKNGEVISGLKRTLPLAARQSVEYSSVIGVARPGQMRRDFQEYVEMERAHPYRTFLHYNTWYDVGFGERYSATSVLSRMDMFGKELVKKRGVTMDSFLLDDGWDDTHSLWDMNDQFPKGLAPLKERAEQYGFELGMWLSPWGGYDQAKADRIAYGTKHGYEIVKGGYALSGPKYYARFEQTCLDFMGKFGVNQFKFDGTGNAGQVFPGSIFDSDFSAAIHLIDRLREQNKAVFIDLTTGTKPSPFWLWYADSIWRGGHDHDFAGEGSWRQRWITYRDGQTYRNIVQKGPLFPLNSLMLHGLIYAQKADHLGDDPQDDFTSEVRSYFGSGTQVQEMYITPSLLSRADWDVLAESAKWSRNNAVTLRDTHWIGGDPLLGEVYGWAAWSRQKGILTLRNPSAKEASFAVDVRKVFELPPGAAELYSAHSPWSADKDMSAVILRADKPHTVSLKAFEVLTLEAEPCQKKNERDGTELCISPQSAHPN